MRIEKKPTGLQQRIMRAMVEDGGRIRHTAAEKAVYDGRGRWVTNVTDYTLRSFFKSGWIETDPEDVHYLRISNLGRAAIARETVKRSSVNGNPNQAREERHERDFQGGSQIRS